MMGEKRTKLDKDMLKIIMPLAWPTIIEQALQTVVQFVDSAMVGQINAAASASVGLTQTVTWLLNGLFFAASIGFLAVISRAIGADDREQAQETACQSVIMAIFLGLIVGAIGVGISKNLPIWLGGSPDIQKNATAYFGIICMPMLFRSASILFGGVLRATGDMRHPMMVNAFMNGLNIIGNFFMIYGTRTVSLFGRDVTIYGTGWGVTGAAIATAISYVVGGVLMTILLFKNDRGVSPRGYKIRLSMPIMNRCMKISIPNALERTTVCLGSTVFLSMVASLGTISLAAHSIAITAESAFYVPGFGFQAAASTLSGQTLGEGNEKKLDRLAITITQVTVITMTLTALLLFLFPEALMSFFTKDPEVIAQGAIALRIVSISEPFFAISLALEGIFNGVGDTKMPFIIATCTMWGVRILSTWVCVHIFGLGLAAVWMCMVADVITRSVFMFGRFKSGGWKKSLF